MAKAYGLTLDPWQENVLEAAMGERADGKWATPRVGVAVPRQNGKGALIEARELAGLLVFGEQSIVHSAHQQQTARVGFDRVRSYFDNYDDLRRKVKSVQAALGREHILLRSGQMLRFPARSKSTIRGFSIDCLILDEAQVFGDLALQAVQPTMAARPNPQMWLLGTPPTPADDGTVFSRFRADGHEKKDHRLCWCEWSCEPGVDLDSREAWAAANPALGIRIGYEAVQDERAALDDDGFARERLGMWQVSLTQAVIDPRSWAAAGDERSVATANLALAVDVDPDRTVATVALAGQRDDDLWHVELDEQRSGVGWLVPYVAGLVVANPGVRAVVLDGASPAASLVDDFERAGVRVTVTDARQMASACGQFYDGVMEQWLRHTSQPQLASSLGVARRRPLGDSWAWNRKNSTADITPVVAVTLALWGAQASKVKKPSRSGEAVFW